MGYTFHLTIDVFFLALFFSNTMLYLEGHPVQRCANNSCSKALEQSFKKVTIRLVWSYPSDFCSCLNTMNAWNLICGAQSSLSVRWALFHLYRPVPLNSVNTNTFSTFGRETTRPNKTKTICAATIREFFIYLFIFLFYLV